MNVKDLNCKGLKVLCRCDFNVPFVDGEISDDNRIVAALPTIKELINKEAKVILMSHLGKIDFKKEPEEIEKAKKKNDLKKVAVRLEELLNHEVLFCPFTSGEGLKKAIEELKDGEILLVQNTRYEKGETKNDENLSKEWASLVDAYVNDAFGTCHRAHCSTYGVAEQLKTQGKQVALGYLVEKEVKSLQKVVNCEERPYVAILGGFKVSDKIKVINSLLKKCDQILIGGAMANTFIKALGGEVGNSPYEEDQLEYAKEMYESGKILLPVDSVIAEDIENPGEIKVVKSCEIPDTFMSLDIGPKTIENYCEVISKAKTVFWNGPMGVFEKKEFQKGTISVCKACAELKDAFTVIGGGDSASACKKFGYDDKFSHVSTGGGASLEMIENDGHLPGIDIVIG